MSDDLHTIYIALLDEGTNVWRPAPARKVGDSTYEVLRPSDYNPDDEQWEFPPGSVVECVSRTDPGGNWMIAVRLREPNRQSA